MKKEFFEKWLEWLGDATLCSAEAIINFMKALGDSFKNYEDEIFNAIRSRFLKEPHLFEAFITHSSGLSPARYGEVVGIISVGLVSIDWLVVDSALELGRYLTKYSGQLNEPLMSNVFLFLENGNSFLRTSALKLIAELPKDRKAMEGFLSILNYNHDPSMRLTALQFLCEDLGAMCENFRCVIERALLDYDDEIYKLALDTLKKIIVSENISEHGKDNRGWAREMLNKEAKTKRYISTMKKSNYSAANSILEEILAVLSSHSKKRVKECYGE